MSVMAEQQPGTDATPVRTPVPVPTYEGDFVLDEHLLLECGRTLAGLRCIMRCMAG